jgi:hypothetical protein
VPASEFESRILTVQVLVQSDPLAAVAVIPEDFGGKVRVAVEGYELTLEVLVSASLLLKATR